MSRDGVLWKWCQSCPRALERPTPHASLFMSGWMLMVWSQSIALQSVYLLCADCPNSLLSLKHVSLCFPPDLHHSPKIEILSPVKKILKPTLKQVNSSKKVGLGSLCVCSKHRVKSQSEFIMSSRWCHVPFLLVWGESQVSCQLWCQSPQFWFGKMIAF